MKGMDLTGYRNLQDRYYEKTMVFCDISMDRDSLISVLSVDFVFINGEKFKAPHKQALKYLMNDDYGSLFFELEKI